MTDIATLGLKVNSKGVVSATKNLKKLESQGEKTQKRAVAMGKAFGKAVGIFATGALIKKAISNTIEQERVTAQLNQVLKSTGRYTAELSDELRAYGAHLQTVSTFGDEAIISITNMLLTFTQLGDDVFPRAQQAVLDVATAMGTDLKSASIQLGKALNDPKEGMTALSRSGITFSQAQKDVIKALVDTGKVAEAQRLILDELETQFGGSAGRIDDQCLLIGSLGSFGLLFLFEELGQHDEARRILRIEFQRTRTRTFGIIDVYRIVTDRVSESED